MDALRQHGQGAGIDSVAVDSVDRPEPGPGELLVEVRAAALNPSDVKQLTGELGGGGTDRAIVGSDVAGDVAAVGAGVDGFDAGDRVFGTGMRPDPRGTVSEYAVLPTSNVAPLPAAVSYETAAAGALVGATAWRALVHHGDPAPGDAVLVHGGSGGVGHLAVQLGSLAGATVVATAGEDAHRRRVTELGATTAVSYRTDDLRAELADAAPAGYDVILDHRLGEYLELDVALAAATGRIVHLAGDLPAIDNTSAMRVKELTLQGVIPTNAPAIRPILDRLARLFASGRLVVDIERTYSLADAPEAVRAQAQESFVGKLVVEP